MRYLITGGAGFIGSHLSERLLDRGDSVIVLDDLSTGSHRNIQAIERHERFRFVYGSVTDSSLVTECVKEADQVFHLASAVGVKLVIEEPVRTIETNINGASVVFGICARYRVPILLTSTSEVYGKSSSLPFAEDTDSVIGPPIHRRWAYACAKALDEFLALAYWRQTGLPVVLARLFNTVGPRQTGRYGMVIPRLVGQALAGEPLTVYGDGTQTRCFCHVRDAIGALIKLLDRPECAGEVYNVGTTEQVSIGDLARRIAELTGSGSSLRLIPYETAYGQGFEDMQHRVPSLDKIRRSIGYAPEHSLTDALEDIIVWERTARSGGKP